MGWPVRRGFDYGVGAGLLLAVYGVAVLGYLIVISWTQPILDAHGFRQTQTAISAYWMLRGGPLLAYQTPVLGSPWSIPFEFPFYQWLVAALSAVSGLTIDHSGRVVSALFFLGSAYLVYLTAMAVRRDKSLAWLCAGCFLASPLLIFWSRAVMIESTAVFFSIAFMWAIAEHVRTEKLSWVAVAGASAVLATLVKVTTFFGFAVVVCSALMWVWLRDREPGYFRRGMRAAAVSAAPVVVALGCLKLWLHMADELKAQTAWGSSLTSESLALWNYGSLAQRVNVDFWRGIVFGRALIDGFGSRLLFAVAATVVLVNSRTRGAGIILLVGYLAPFLVFTNLHFVHDYYQCANIVFATSVMALGVWSLKTGIAGRLRALPAFAALVVCILSWGKIGHGYAPIIRQDFAAMKVTALANELRQATGPDSGVLLVGLGWSSEVPYYAERRTLMLPAWTPLAAYAKVADPERAFGSVKVGAVVVCPDELPKEAETRVEMGAVVAKYTAGRNRSQVAGCDIYI